MAINAADDVEEIYKRIQELKPPSVLRSGTQFSHCSHCPKAPYESCQTTCIDEARNQGWYMPDYFS